MQTQDAATMAVFKLWPWIETNWRRLAIGAGVVAAVVVLVSFRSWDRAQNEVAAGVALTQVSLTVAANTTASQLADSYLNVAHSHPGTLASERALLQAAATLFEASRYDEAQTQFQNYLDAHPNGLFAVTARFGLAASFEAQGKMDLAFAAYEKVSTDSSDAMTLAAAKFALGRLNEQQGKLAEAVDNYTDVARTLNPNSSLASEASMHASELKLKLAATPPPITVKP